MSKHFLFTLLRFLLVLLFIVCGFYILVFTAKLTYPFIIGLIIAYMMNPLVIFFKKRLGLPRGLSTFFSIIVFFGIVIALLTILISEIISGLNFLMNVVPSSFADLMNYLEHYFVATLIPKYELFTSKFSRLDTNSQEAIINTVRDFSDTFIVHGQEILTGLLKGMTTFLSSVPSLLTTLIISLLATFFISKDWDRLKEKATNVMPQKAKANSKALAEHLQMALIGFVKSQITLISYTGLIVLVGLLFLKVPYAITLSLIIGFVDLLPYLGTGLIFTPWIIYLFFVGNTPLAVGLLILYAIVIIQRQIMEPKVLSSNIGLDPLATLIAMFVGYQLLGFIGLILGPIALVTIGALHQTGLTIATWNFIFGKKDIIK